MLALWRQTYHGFSWDGVTDYLESQTHQRGVKHSMGYVKLCMQIRKPSNKLM